MAVTVRQRARSLAQVVNDFLWPEGGDVGGPDPTQSVRHQAIAEVLCRLPEEAYGKLKEVANSVRWFIPSRETGGMVCSFVATDSPKNKKNPAHFRAPYAKVLYLSPHLERAAWDIVVAVVVHEVAHIVLDHPLYNSPQEGEAHEQETFTTLCRWGFGDEARKLARVNKWRESWEQALGCKFTQEQSKQQKRKGSDKEA